VALVAVGLAVKSVGVVRVWAVGWAAADEAQERGQQRRLLLLLLLLLPLLLAVQLHDLLQAEQPRD
jgi:hypothetical protein